MIPSVQAHRRFLHLAVMALLAIPAFPQEPSKYDKTTETTIKGTVVELKLVPPTGAKSFAYLVTRIGPDKEKDTIQIFLCPKTFLDQMGISFKADDAIEIRGSKVRQSGADLILAREIVKGGETITFRFPDGKPAW